MGFKWARILSPSAFFRWNIVEPTEGNIIWFDSKVQNCLNAGVSVLGTIGTNDFWPSWASSGEYFDLSKYGTFCYKLADHYSGKVDY